MNIAGECKVCGHLYDVTTTVGCPACRAARVAEAFKPIDPLRTALSTTSWGQLSTAQKNVINEHLEEQSYMRGSNFTIAQGMEQKVYRIPRGEAEQVYELKRMRKLIGRL